MLEITLDRRAEKPAYAQIVEQVIRSICEGRLKIGDRLPSERELAAQLGIARGTVKKAYERLAHNHVIEMTRGSGSYVSSEQDVLEEGRKEQAVRKMHRLIRELEKLDFSPREIGTLFQVLLAERQRSRSAFHLAAVDCNPEALTVFERQLSHIRHVMVHKFPLHEVLKNRIMQRNLAEYDLILTTSTHNEELRGALPGCREKILPAVLSPGRQTIIDLAQLSKESRIGILCQSENFRNIIRNHLRHYQVRSGNVTALVAPEPELIGLHELLEHCDVLIVPPRCESIHSRALEPDFRNFAERGGKLIHFDYQIERGALTFIEEKISGLLLERDRKGRQS